MSLSLRNSFVRSLSPRKIQFRPLSNKASGTYEEWNEGPEVEWETEPDWLEESDSDAIFPDARNRRRRVRRVFSGIQPTGVPHLGNYLGALRQWKRLHDQSQDPKLAGNHTVRQYYSIVDLHALTADTPPAVRLRQRKESYAALLAIGLSNTDKTSVFFQSDVSCHSELMWILSTIASTGYLSRMTQWKSKLNLPDNVNLDSDEATAKLKLGLFSYPVLQAADILLYKADLVPVGHDQLQHIEFARTLARSFNSHIKESWGSTIFKIPAPVLSPAQRLMSLKKPTQKMSKSDPDPKSQILITDSAEEIYAKIKGAVTDSTPGISYDPVERPGVSNLIDILKYTTNSSEPSEFIARDMSSLSMRAMKEKVAWEVIQALQGIREKFLDLMQPNNDQLFREVTKGAIKARRRATATLTDVQCSLGLLALHLSDPRRGFEVGGMDDDSDTALDVGCDELVEPQRRRTKSPG
ncbi:tryptophan-tRNA ligase [Rhinocladiella mackenziei CBS 650.93]|uniref:tryptophan--tRNA ligase n=1 Tax=Rhinocladiella mackenziei CBS 650.93 TaxID=1442369 RepID=A0A0D2G5Z0_9EURO|nr:tryptophan-tRNA ligase [Rhinocladiella mackenziei CBS 650.93]KIX10357.1 tryptophan-tRNA ligase [Rhinocladiella mackenziei CBS 650.93]